MIRKFFERAIYVASKDKKIKDREAINNSNGIVNFQLDDTENEFNNLSIYTKTSEWNDENHYKRMGFFCALGKVAEPEKAFTDLLSEQQKLCEERIANLNELFFFANQRLEGKIEKAKKSLDEIEFKELQYLGEIPTLEQENNDNKNRLHQIKQELQKLYELIGSKRENLIRARILSVRQELESLIENYRSVYNKRFEANKQNFENNKEAIDYKRKYFECLKLQIEEQRQQVISKINSLKIDGINPYVVNFIFTVGLAGAMAGGYLFSIFALSKHLNSESLNFFFIKGIYNFILKTFPDRALWNQGIILFGLWIVFIVMITTIAWLCDLFIGKSRNKDDIKHQLDFDSRRRQNPFSFKVYAESTSFFQLWVAIIPLLVIFGFILIIIFLGIQPTGIESLDVAISGSIMGALFIFMKSGLMYVYIVRILEPRIQRSPDQSFVKNNMELVFATLFFILSTTAMLFLEGHPGKRDPIIIFEFIAVMLISSFLLAYAIRLKGLISTLNYLDTRISLLSEAIKDKMRPLPLNLSQTENDIFNKEYLSLHKQLLILIQIKNEMTNYLLRGDESGWRKVRKILIEPFNRIKDWLIREFSKKHHEDEIIYVYDLNKFTYLEKQIFAKEITMIEDFKITMQNIKHEIELLSEEIKLRKEGRSQYLKEIYEMKHGLLNQINNYKIAQQNLRKNLFERVTIERVYFEKIIICLREGFDLGMWYRLNKLGPVPEYYTSDLNIYKQDS